MERVDVDQFSVGGDGALIEGDQHADVEGVHLADPHFDHLALLGAQRVGESDHETVEIVAHCDGSADRRAHPVLEHLDEGHEEVVAPVVELLDEGVGVGAALVAEYVQALMDGVAVEVFFLAETLHDQLLEVARPSPARYHIAESM